MSGIVLGFLIISYIASLWYKDITHILYGIGVIIFLYLNKVLEELKKK